MTTTLDDLWARLIRVNSLTFTARSGVDTGWNGTGTGIIHVEFADDTIVFAESGTWTPTSSGKRSRFHNVFRWTKVDSRIRLEHLRFGPDHPVYLFDLEPSSERQWRSSSAHVCSADCYTAHLQVTDAELVLNWRVDGPHKSEAIAYRYF